MHSSYGVPTHPNGIAKFLTRVGFGLALAFAGIANYRDPTFAESVGRGLGALEPIGIVWGYALPALMLVGGLLITFGVFMRAAAWIAGLALVTMPAGLMLKAAVLGLSPTEMMPEAITSLVWILVYLPAVRGGCCGCGSHAKCDVPAVPGKPMPSMPSKPGPMIAKSAPVAPAVTMKAAVKPPVKKAPAKKKK